MKPLKSVPQQALYSKKAEADDLRNAIQHAFALWQKQRVWAMVRNNAMAQDF